MSAVPEDVKALVPLLERLKRQAVCIRCNCIACDREGAGELHDHVCTDGPGCVETREKLQKRMRGLRYLCAEAARDLAARPSVPPVPDAREQRRVVAWLHERAAIMADPKAKEILNSAANALGSFNAAERQRLRAETEAK